MAKVRKLRSHMMVPLLAVFLLMWVGIVVGSTRTQVQEADQALRAQLYKTQQQLAYQYQKVLSQYGDGTPVNLTGWISRGAIDLFHLGGGAVLVMTDPSGSIQQSQVAWAHGQEEIGDHTWTLLLDEVLDDEGQLKLAHWLSAHTKSGQYMFDVLGEKNQIFARVTGEERPAQSLLVERIELVHPDGTVELVIDTGFRSTASVTKDFRFFSLESYLLFDPFISGYPQPTPELQLKRIRTAQELLAREVFEPESLSLGSGGLKYESMANGQLLYGSFDSTDSEEYPYRYGIAVVRNTLPMVMWKNRSFYVNTFLLTLLSALFLGICLSRKVSRPVEELCKQAQEGTEARSGSIQELNTLAHAINQGREQMEEQLRREQDFTRAAAHELKTPLAVLRAHIEALHENIVPENRERYFQIALEETDSMSQLISSLLELSRLENGGSLEVEALDLSTLVRSVFEPLALPLERKNMTLTLNLSPMEIRGDKARIQSAVDNLASNALRYGAEAGKVEVSLVQEGKTAQLTVYNDGTPIPEEHLPHLFEPFYRVDKARSRDLGGTGLGLTIVKAAAEAHGGTCTVENRETGVQFTLSLPVSH